MSTDSFWLSHRYAVDDAEWRTATAERTIDELEREITAQSGERNELRPENHRHRGRHSSRWKSG